MYEAGNRSVRRDHDQHRRTDHDDHADHGRVGGDARAPDRHAAGEHDHRHDHDGAGHIHAPAGFGKAFAIGITLKTGLVCESAQSRNPTGINQIRYLPCRSASEPHADSHRAWLRAAARALRG